MFDVVKGIHSLSNIQEVYHFRLKMFFVVVLYWLPSLACASVTWEPDWKADSPVLCPLPPIRD